MSYQSKINNNESKENIFLEKQKSYQIYKETNIEGYDVAVNYIYVHILNTNSFLWMDALEFLNSGTVILNKLSPWGV